MKKKAIFGFIFSIILLFLTGCSEQYTVDYPQVEDMKEVAIQFWNTEEIPNGYTIEYAKETRYVFYVTKDDVQVTFNVYDITPEITEISFLVDNDIEGAVFVLCVGMFILGIFVALLFKD